MLGLAAMNTLSPHLKAGEFHILTHDLNDFGFVDAKLSFDNVKSCTVFPSHSNNPVNFCFRKFFFDHYFFDKTTLIEPHFAIFHCRVSVSFAILCLLHLLVFVVLMMLVHPIRRVVVIGLGAGRDKKAALNSGFFRFLEIDGELTFPFAVK